MALITNRRARFDYEILNTLEAGLSLLGTEVKSLRNGQGKLDGSYVVIRDGVALLVGASIPPFQQKNTSPSYDPERARNLLLTQKELKELELKSEKQGLTIVPLSLYNKGQFLKLEIAIARGKKKTDKRQSIMKRETNRSIEREMKRG